MPEDRFKELILQPHKLGWVFGYKDLSELHTNWIKYLFDSHGHKALRAHRNSFKTSALVVGIIRELFLYPSKTILLLRKTDELSGKVLSFTQSKIESENGIKFFKTCYNFQKIQGEIWNNSRMLLSINTARQVESNLESIGIGANITGKHFDLIVVDDIITDIDRYSRAERERVKNYVYELLNIIKRGGKIIFTGTPWHKEDAWEIIQNICGEIKDYDCYTTGIMTIDQIIEERRIRPPSLFAANYELKHINEEGRLFKNPFLGKTPAGIKKLGFLDPAYGGNHTALTIGGVENGKIYLTGCIWNKSVIDLYSEILQKLKQENCGTLYIESNADKGYSVRDLSRLRGGFIKPFWEKENKHIKITQNLYKFWENIIIDESAEPDWINEILDYAEGEEPDDAPDSAASLIKIMRMLKKK